MPHPRIIALTGRAQAGKDSVRSFLEKAYDYAGLAFADPLRELRKSFLDIVGAPDVYNTDETLKQKVIPELGVSRRHLEQTLGTEWGRDCIRQDLWTWLLKRRAQSLLDLGYNIVISDLRFLNEEVLVRELGGEIWRIVRWDESPVDQSHRSESELDLLKPDFTIQNFASIPALHQNVDLALRSSRHNNNQHSR